MKVPATRRAVVLALFVLIPLLSPAQKEKKIFLLPDDRIYPLVIMDPVESQSAGSIATWNRSGEKRGEYLAQFSIGTNSPIFQLVTERSRWEMAFEVAAFTQFEISRIDNNTYRGSLLNNDYKIGLALSREKKDLLIRSRIYHKSSHLGDDYLVSMDSLILNDKSENYEQFDLDLMWKKERGYFYIGMGEIITINTSRKRFSTHTGFYRVWGKPGKRINAFSAFDMKALAEHSYSPDIKVGTGFEFRPFRHALRIWIEYYSGEIPYSIIRYGKIQWLGLAGMLEW